MQLIKKTLTYFVSIFLASTVSIAQAHPGHDATVGFVGGLLHPLSGVDHLLMILLVGLWSVFKLKKFFLGPVFFMSGMMLGILFGLQVGAIPWFEMGIAVSLMAIGLFIYFTKQLLSPIALGLIAFFGLFHGFAHTDANSFYEASQWVIYKDLLGLLVSTSALHCIGGLIAFMVRDHKLMISRLIGSFTVMYGVTLSYFLILQGHGSLV